MYGGSKHTKNVDRLSETGTYNEEDSKCPRVEDLVAKISNIIKRQMLEGGGGTEFKTYPYIVGWLGFEVHLMFEYSFYVYFMGKRVVSLVENYETMAIDVPCLEGDRDVSHTVRVEYEWNPPRCGVCIVFAHDKSTCLKQVVADVNKQSGKANDEFQNASKKAFHGLQLNAGEFDSKHGPYVELMVNSSNDNKVGKSSVQANEYSERHVEDIYKTREFKASKCSKSESEIGNKSMYER
nr:hypothetical protein [Tanacetum cinerariifolium]